VLTVRQQIELGKLVCPQTRRPLFWIGDTALAAEGGEHYVVRNGVPILHVNQAVQQSYLSQADSQMSREYAEQPAPARRLVRRLTQLRDDHRSPRSLASLAEVTDKMPDDALCLSIGGGPGRAHSSLTNLNIDAFPNVDVVGDAYRLPYATAAVDAIHCEAVLEHLERPELALAEMKRVLVPGGLAFLSVPFLQIYHPYPNHYQNYSAEGLAAVAAHAGFDVVDRGTCVGPTFAMVDLLSNYFRLFTRPRFVGRSLWLLTRCAGRSFVRLDRGLNQRDDSHHMASTVYCLGRRT